MEGINDMVKEVADEASGIRWEHLEMMAAAYYKATCIDPCHVVLVEEHDRNTIRWYFSDKRTQLRLKSEVYWDSDGRLWENVSPKLWED